MQIVGFGAQQLSATPQIFQALSLGGSAPVPPALLFGTPNDRVVPVQQTSNGVLPLNLTLQAQPTANAIQQISRSASLAGLSSSPAQPATPVPIVTSPAVQSAPPNSTAFVGATVPNEQVVQGTVAPPGTVPLPTPPADVTFTVVAAPPDQTATQTLAQDAIAPQPQSGPPPPPPPFTLSNSGDGHAASAKETQQTTPAAGTPAQTSSQTTAAGGGSTPALPPAANPSLVQQVVSTVQSLLIGKIYPAPVFSFLV